MIRAAESAVRGTVIGRVKIDGDVATAGSPVTVRIDVSMTYGTPIPETVERLRAEVARRLRAHTELDVTAIDITVHDIRLLSGEEER